MDGGMVQRVRETVPLIHCITNYVTAGDVANMLLAAGGSPIMADGIHEVEDITSICQGLVINLGTLNERTVKSMLKAGRRAAALGHPIVFDPVGAGASAFRTKTAGRILSELPCTVIRGNVSEIKALAKISAEDSGSARAGDVEEHGNSQIRAVEEHNISRGVDADERDVATEENLDQMCSFIKAFSARTGAVVVMTGAIDLVAGREPDEVLSQPGGSGICAEGEISVRAIRNGHPMMAKITGTGCMLDAVTAAYICANPRHTAEAAAAAVAAEGLCGELAYEKVKAENSGLGSFRVHLLDFMGKLDDTQLNGGAKIEIRT